MNPQCLVEAEGIGQRQTRPAAVLVPAGRGCRTEPGTLRTDQMGRSLEQDLALPNVLTHPREVQRAEGAEAA